MKIIYFANADIGAVSAGCDDLDKNSNKTRDLFKINF